MSTLRELLSRTENRLAAAGIETPDLDARFLIEGALRLSPAEIRLNSARAVSDEERTRVERFVERRAAHEPVGRILGRRDFWTLELALSPATLEPRPDTETVVEATLAVLPNRTAPLRLLDLGTGTGCLLLALLAELPNATGLGIDISPEAVETAGGNAARNGLADRARFRVGNWGEGLERSFDIVVSNPPYIPTRTIDELSPEVRLFDPLRALDGGLDGLDAYRIIAAQAPGLLNPGGTLALEVGWDQAAVVAELVGAAGLSVSGVFRDLGGIERCVRAESPR